MVEALLFVEYIGGAQATFVVPAKFNPIPVIPAIVANGIESFEAPASLDAFSYDEAGMTSADCEVSSFGGIGDAELECVA